MLRNYFTLYHLARELHELLEGGFVFEVYSQQKNEITISLITNKGDHLQLIIVTGHPRLCVYTRQGLNRKHRNTAELMPEISEKKISGVIIDPRDRIIRLQLAENYVIILQLFSAKTNVLLETGDRIINAFKKNPPASRLEKQEKIIRPEILRSLEALVYNPDLFVDRLQETGVQDIAGKLGQMLPGFDRLLVRELLCRCGEKCLQKEIHTQLSALFYELLDPLPSVNLDTKKGPLFSILHNPEKNAVRFDSVLDGLNFYSIKTWQHLTTRKLVHDLGGLLRQKKKKIAGELAHFQPEKLKKQAEEYERNGHLLMANLYHPNHDKEHITVTNFLDPSSPSMVIPLKPELNLQQNAAVFFRKASKTRDKIEGGMRRKAVVQKQQRELDNLIMLSAELSSPSEVRSFYETHRPTLKILGLESTSKKEKRELPFRKFAITQNTVLYVGKNARNNEQLTFSFAKQNDIWLHARGTSGSHCILRGASMQHSTEIMRAAEIAAYYSAAKHSELVPVMYTEKKYVRRAKNLPPGQVLVEKEKVIMAQPSKY